MQLRPQKRSTPPALRLLTLLLCAIAASPACSSDSDPELPVTPDASSEAAAGKAGQGGSSAEGGIGGTNQGGTNQGGSGLGGSSQGGNGLGGSAADGGVAGSGQGGMGGFGECTAQETCTDMSGGKGKVFACIPSDTSVLPECLNGAFGAGCPADLACFETGAQPAAICAAKTGKTPAGATSCSNNAQCTTSGQVCVPMASGSVCLTAGCTPPSCPAGKLTVFAQNGLTGERTFCNCATLCKP